MSRFEKAHAAARAMIAGMPRAYETLNGCLATAGDLAALLVARDVAGSRGPIDILTEDRREAAAETITALEVVMIPHGDLPRVVGTAKTPVTASGTLGRPWAVTARKVTIGRLELTIDATTPGLHAEPPSFTHDEGVIDRAWRAALVMEGVEPALVARASTGRTTVDDDRYATVECPTGHDARLALRERYAEPDRHTPAQLAELLRGHARVVCRVQEEHATMSLLADGVEEALQDVALDHPGVRFSAPALQSVGAYRHGGKGETVTFSSRMTYLSPGLVEVERGVVVVGRMGDTTPTHDNARKVAEMHTKRARLLAAHGGVRVDRHGVALLAACGHDVDAMIAAARAGASAPASTDPAHVTIAEGTVNATCRIADGTWWRSGRIHVDKAFSDAVLAALAGRPARLVVDLPELEGAVIRRATRATDGRSVIQMEPAWEIRT